MASPYFGGASSPAPSSAPKSTYFGSAPAGPKSKKKEDGKSVLGFLDNLTDDIDEAIRGIPNAAVNIGSALGHDIFLDPMRPVNESETWNKIVKPLVESYKETYGPLADGDFDKFAEGVYDNPLGPLLDLTLVAGVGVNATAKAGTKLAAAGKIDDASRLAQLGKPGTIRLATPDGGFVEKATSARPTTKLMQQGIDAMLKNAPADVRVIGEYSRAGRLEKRGTDIESIKHMLAGDDFSRVFSQMNAKERAAFSILARTPTKELLDGWKNLIRENADGPSVLSILEDPKVMGLWENPSKKMLEAYAAAEKLSKTQVELLSKRGVFHEALAETRKYLGARLASGAQYLDEATVKTQADLLARNAKVDIEALQGQLGALEREVKRVGKSSTKGAAYPSTAKTVDSSALNTGRNLLRPVPGLRSEIKDLEAQLKVQEAKVRSAKRTLDSKKSGMDKAPSVNAGRKAGNTAAELRAAIDEKKAMIASIEKQARDIAKDAVPSTGVTADSKYFGSSKGASTAKVKNAQAAELRKRIAERKARLEADVAELESGVVGGKDIFTLRDEIAAAGRPQPIYIPDKLMASKRGAPPSTGTGGKGPQANPVRENRGVLFSIGRLALDTDVLSAEFLKTVRYELYSSRHDILIQRAIPVDSLPQGYTFIRRRTGEKIPNTVQGEQEFLQQLDRVVPDNPEKTVKQDLELTTEDRAFAEMAEDGRYLAVPENYARAVTGEFTRSTNAINKFISAPLTVWRALVLGLRPAYLVNNVVGHHMMYAIRFAGMDGLRSYLNMIYNTNGAATVRKMLNMKDIPKGISQQFITEFFPEQSKAGTFVGSQLPANRLGKFLGRTKAGLVPADRAAEAGMRRAAVEAALRKDPEFRAFVKDMPSQIRSFQDSAEQAMAWNPQIAERVSAEVNSALGDFLALGQFEKNVVRQIFPFYAWFKAITKVTLRLPVDMPVRTTLLAQLGEIGTQASEDDFGSPLPRWLRGAIPLGGDSVLPTSGFNPFGTVPQVASGVRALLPSPEKRNRDDLLGMMNPFLAAAIENFGEQDPGGFANDIFRRVGEDLPQTKLVSPPSRASYNGDDRLREILAYMGVPVKNLDRREVARQAREGR